MCETGDVMCAVMQLDRQCGCQRREEEEEEEERWCVWNGRTSPVSLASSTASTAPLLSTMLT